MTEKTKNQNIIESISYKVKFIEEDNSNSDQTGIRSDILEEKTVEKFRAIAQNFVTFLQVLWQYTAEIGSVAQNTSLLNFAKLPSLLDKLLEREKEASSNEKPFANFIISIKKKDLKTKSLTIPIFEIGHLKKLNEYFKYRNRAVHLLHETVLQQMVNAWERVLSEILEWKFKSDPDSIPKERTITYSKILNFKDINDVQKHVIENEIGEFLKRNTTLEQIRYFRKNLNINLESNFPLVHDLCEIVLRRHVIVHSGGIANREYLNRAKKLKNLKLELPSEGDQLSGSASYVRRSWSILYSAGVILLHLLAVGHARKKKSKEDEDDADSFLINAAFNNIKNKQYFSAQLILEYANKRRLAQPTSQLMVRVNLAQTYKWQDDPGKCNEILDGQDWRSCSANFKLCVAALKDDYKSFCDNLKIAMQEKSITLEDLYEWPVFQAVRKKEKFKEDVKNIFGSDYDEDDIQNKPVLLDFESEKKLSEMLGKFQKADEPASVPHRGE